VKVSWAPIAKRDRDSQIAYIAERNPSAAIDMGDAIEVTVQLLNDYPLSGRPGRAKGSRELAVTGTPYVIVYRATQAGVVILRLLHGAQRWPSRS
jgi:toxin ParE1/3/4